MGRIEEFVEKLKRSEAKISQDLRKTRGEKFMKRYGALEQVRGLIQSSEDLVKPGGPGIGTVSYWTRGVSRSRR